MEIRILQDGRVVFIAPDDDLIEVAERLEPNRRELVARKEKRQDGTDDSG